MTNQPEPQPIPARPAVCPTCGHPAPNPLTGIRPGGATPTSLPGPTTPVVIPLHHAPFAHH
ncbi:hypothetical protein [Streptomyces aidingensis]|uniref:Uncharacterized protein n=1 Tax=Streptomyces aidingensis TaxID=910347 RepID=A0A1I1PTK0_9ACTN|nr:hypothetical protein [Streptomyces aidingensis]SFD13196.1 hypothetical protein SAMN05421773_11044 [Streptomyces aidingensis]